MGHAIDPRTRSGGTAPATLDGISILAVRKDTTGAIDPNGDVTPLQVDSEGALKVVGTASANSQYTVDTSSSGTENGQVALVIRNDAGGSLVSANNKRSALQVDANGALRVIPATHPVTQSGTWNVGLSTGSNVVGGVTQSGTWNVGLSTGSNTIGAVTQSGTWNVGLSTGSNVIGAVTQSGTWNVGSITTLPALPTGSNTIGNIGSITTLPALPTGGNTIGLVGVTGTVTVGTHAVTQSGTWNVGLSAGTNDIGGVKMTHKPTPYKLISAATTNATSVSATANTLLYSCYISNTNAAVRYVKFYNKASAPTVGTDIPVLVFAVPTGAPVALSFPAGTNFTTGLAFAITTGAADSDTNAVAASEVIVNLMYATY